MQDIKNAAELQSKMIEKAKELLKDGIVDRVIGWEKGLFDYDITPAVFKTAEELDKNFVYNEYCAATVSKYLVKESANGGKILSFMKPNDTYSFNQILKEYRAKKENCYIIGIPCNEELSAKGKPCEFCSGKIHVVYDELLGVDENAQADKALQNEKRFDGVKELETASADDRFSFWRTELSKCIRCNACRNVCPACTCIQCVFDNPTAGFEQRIAANSFEENQFHIIRAFHVASRCTDCGECSRVCPENIPLHLLNRKMIKDINELYGEYQAGEDLESDTPLQSYTMDDANPSIIHTRSEACEDHKGDKE